MAKIRERERAAILNAVAGGVTPRQGIQHIQVGRADEVEAMIHDIKEIEEGAASFRIFQGSYGSGKSFLLTLTKTLALKRNLIVMSADFSPDRRLYSSSGKATALYRELVRSMSTSTCPDGGAMAELLDTVDEKVSLGDQKFLASIRKLPYGFDALTVCMRWHRAKHPTTKAEERDSFIMQDACLRWMSGESTADHKRMLGVRSTIGDEGAYDALKMLAMLAHAAGYAGLLVELDECVNLWKINNAQSRDRNYEQILRIFNECLQGDAHYIGFILGGTPEFVMDPRRGLFSYDALRTRLMSSDFGKDGNGVDTTGPVIDLMPLTQEDLLTLLCNITNVDALGDKGDWRVSTDQMTEFLRRFYNTLGADYYKTPREIIKSYVELLRAMEQRGLTFEQALGSVEIEKPKRDSGLGAALSQAKQKDGVPDEDPDTRYVDDADADFGF